jgi:hypothetical protein
MHGRDGEIKKFSHKTCMGEIIVRCRHRWNDNIKIHLK